MKTANGGELATQGPVCVVNQLGCAKTRWGMTAMIQSIAVRRGYFTRTRCEFASATWTNTEWPPVEKPNLGGIVTQVISTQGSD